MVRGGRCALDYLLPFRSRRAVMHPHDRRVCWSLCKQRTVAWHVQCVSNHERCLRGPDSRNRSASLTNNPQLPSTSRCTVTVRVTPAVATGYRSEWYVTVLAQDCHSVSSPPSTLFWAVASRLAGRQSVSIVRLRSPVLHRDTCVVQFMSILERRVKNVSPCEAQACRNIRDGIILARLVRKNISIHEGIRVKKSRGEQSCG
jgi:hypothetical protein